MATEDLIGLQYGIEVKRAKANIAQSVTTSSVIAAVPNKKIRVVFLACIAGGVATNLTFNSASAAITPVFANGANGGAVLPFNPAGWFESNAGEALTVTTGAGSSTGILVGYIEV